MFRAKFFVLSMILFLFTIQIHTDKPKIHFKVKKVIPNKVYLEKGGKGLKIKLIGSSLHRIKSVQVKKVWRKKFLKSNITAMLVKKGSTSYRQWIFLKAKTNASLGKNYILRLFEKKVKDKTPFMDVSPKLLKIEVVRLKVKKKMKAPVTTAVAKKPTPVKRATPARIKPRMVQKKPVIRSTSIRNLNLQMGKTQRIVIKGTDLDQVMRVQAILKDKPAKDIDVKIMSRSKSAITVLAQVKKNTQPGEYRLQFVNKNKTLTLVSAVRMKWLVAATDLQPTPSPTKIESTYFSPREIKSGESSTLTIILDNPAIDSGEIIEVGSGGDLWESFPEQVTIPSGKKQTTLTLKTNGARVSVPSTQNYGITLLYKNKGVAPLVKVTDIQQPPPDPCLSYTFTINPDTVNAGETVTGRIELGCPAPAVGAEVRIYVPGFASSIQSIPEKVWVLGGQKIKTFDIVTDPSLTMDVTAVIETSYRGPNQTANLNIRCPQLIDLTLPSETITIGQSMSGTVTIDKNAPQGGFLVRFQITATSGNPSHYISVSPSSVRIPAGQKQGSFTVETHGTSIDKDYVYVLNARGNALKWRGIHLWPQVGITSITTHSAAHHPPYVYNENPSYPPVDARKGGIVKVYVNLNYRAPRGGFTTPISKSSNDSELLNAVTVPNTFTVPFFNFFESFDAQTSPVSKEGMVSITASGRTAVIRFKFPPPLGGVSGYSTQVKGGKTVQWYVYVDRESEVGPIDINLSSSDPEVATVPETVTITGTGSQPRFCYFTIETSPVSEEKTVTITATDGTVTKTRTLTITP